MREKTELRRHRAMGYTAVPKRLLLDKGLSFKAKGLYATVLALPDIKADGSPFDFSVNGLTVICKEGRDAIYAALKELKENGWLLVFQEKGDDGKFGCTVYDFLPEPVEVSPKSEDDCCPSSDGGDSDEPVVGKPCREKPHTDYPHTENPTQRYNITKDNSKEKINSSSSSRVNDVFVKKGQWPELSDVWVEELMLMIRRFKSINLTKADMLRHYEDFKAQESAKWTDDHAETHSNWRAHFSNYLRKSIEVKKVQEARGGKAADNEAPTIKGSYLASVEETNKMLEEKKKGTSYCPDWFLKKHGKQKY